MYIIVCSIRFGMLTFVFMSLVLCEGVENISEWFDYLLDALSGWLSPSTKRHRRYYVDSLDSLEVLVES